MKNKQALVPKLRFREFEKVWKKNELSQVAQIQRGRFSPRPRNNPIYYNGSIPFVQTSDIVNSNGKVSTYKQTLNKKGLKVSKLFLEGSILMTIAANIGYAGVLQMDMACPDSLVGFSCYPETHNYFLNYIFEIEQPRMDYLAVEAAQKNINIAFLEPYIVSIPTLPEQTKIAAFLTSVDDRIDQLKRKKSLIQDYKKGVMQKIFSQELRFHDDQGKPFPDWVEKKLGEVYTYQTTNSYSRDKLNYESGVVYNIHYGDIHTKFNAHFYLSDERVPYLNSDIDIEKIKPECFLKIGDIVLADASEDYADIGKSIEIIDLNEAQVVAGLHTYILRPDTSEISKGFGAYLMQARPTRLEVMRVAQGTKVLGLPKAYFSFVVLNIPHPEEQTKIANFLSAIDRKIEQAATQITENQTYKKGLLQQMFV